MSDTHDLPDNAEAVFRRILRRKLVERGYHDDQIEAKILKLLQNGASLRLDVEAILRS